MNLVSPLIIKTLLKMEDTSSMAAIVTRDMVDNAGRVTQAYKRDINDGKERLIEENLTTLIWGFGIGFIKKFLFNPLAKKFTAVRHPNFNLTLLNDGVQKLTPELVSKFAPSDTHLMKLASDSALQKTYKLMGSLKFFIATGIPIALISFGIPTINQAMTKKRLRKQYFEKQKHLYLNNNQPLKQASVFKNFQAGGVKFSGNWVNSLSKVVENDRLNTLLVDGTISGGRTYKARNKYEKLEVIFQEAGIIFFLYYAADYIQDKLSGLVDKYKHTTSNLSFQSIKTLTSNDLNTLSTVQLEILETLDEKTLVQKIHNALLSPKSSSPQFNAIVDLSQQQGFIPINNKTLDITQKIDTNAIKNLTGEIKKIKALSGNTKSGIEALLKNSFRYRVGTFLIANALCAVSLGWVIPKLKQEITRQLTGSDQFPGVM